MVPRQQGGGGRDVVVSQVGLAGLPIRKMVKIQAEIHSQAVAWATGPVPYCPIR